MNWTRNRRSAARQESSAENLRYATSLNRETISGLFMREKKRNANCAEINKMVTGPCSSRVGHWSDRWHRAIHLIGNGQVAVWATTALHQQVKSLQICQFNVGGISTFEMNTQWRIYLLRDQLKTRYVPVYMPHSKNKPLFEVVSCLFWLWSSRKERKRNLVVFEDVTYGKLSATYFQRFGCW